MVACGMRAQVAIVGLIAQDALFGKGGDLLFGPK